MRHSTLLFVSDFKLKCRLVKRLIYNDLFFYEAQDGNEAVIKQIYLGKKLNLVIFEYVETKEAEIFHMVTELRENNKDLCFLMIIPEYKIKWIDLASKYNINDLLVLPFDDEEFIRKVVSLTPKSDKTNAIAQAGSYEIVNEEMRKSKVGGYPLSFVLVSILDLSDIESKVFEQKLALESQSKDSLLFWEGNMYLMLYPYCKKSNLEVVKRKVLQAYDESAKKLHTVRDILIHGVTYPDDGESLDEILENLKSGIELSQRASISKECHNAYSSQQVLSLINKLINLENK